MHTDNERTKNGTDQELTPTNPDCKCCNDWNMIALHSCHLPSITLAALDLKLTRFCSTRNTHHFPVRFCRPDAHRAAQFAQSQRTWYSQSGHRHSRHPWFSSHGSDPCNLTFPQIGAFPISCLNAGACPISCLTAARRFGPVRACVIGSRVASEIPAFPIMV